MDVVGKNNNGITCTDGKIWSGFKISRNQQGEPSMQTAKCGNIVAQNDIYNLKKGDQLNNLCECEEINEKNGEFTCPSGKFITNYNPSAKKASCCILCNGDNSVKGTYDPKDCNILFKDKNVLDVTCPDNTFLGSININSNNSKLSCCSPNFKNQTQSPQTDNPNCKKYGLEQCNMDLIKSTEAKCQEYGMRYFDSTDNKYKNTDSYMDCHIDNFSKLENLCKEHNINPCNFYSLRQNQLTDIFKIKNDIGKIDAIQGIYEQKFNDFGLAGNQTLTIILVILGLLVTVMAIYIVLKN